MKIFNFLFSIGSFVMPQMVCVQMPDTSLEQAVQTVDSVVVLNDILNIQGGFDRVTYSHSDGSILEPFDYSIKVFSDSVQVYICNRSSSASLKRTFPLTSQKHSLFVNRLKKLDLHYKFQPNKRKMKVGGSSDYLSISRGDSVLFSTRNYSPVTLPGKVITKDDVWQLFTNCLPVSFSNLRSELKRRTPDLNL